MLIAASVSGVHFDKDALQVRFDTQETTIRSMFTNITFDLYRTTGSNSVQALNRLLRQRNAVTTNAVISSTSILPTPTATEPPPDHTEIGNLSWSPILNSTFGLGDNLPLTFELGCRNCSGTGQVELEITDIKFNDLFSEDDDPFEKGAIQLDLTGFSLSIGLIVAPKNNTDNSLTILELPAIEGIDVSDSDVVRLCVVGADIDSSRSMVSATSA